MAEGFDMPAGNLKSTPGCGTCATIPTKMTKPGENRIGLEYSVGFMVE
jgi:hypothetical protein